jgi:hypothetical protein
MGQLTPYQIDSRVNIKRAAPAHILALADSNNVLLAFYERPALTGVDIVLTGVDIVMRARIMY